MKRTFGRTLFLVVAALVTLAVVGLRTEYAGEQVCGQLRQRLPRLTGLEFGIGKCRLDPLRGGVEVTGFNVREKFADEPLFAADRLLVRIGTFDVITGSVRVERVEVERPRVNLDLEKLAQGTPEAPARRSRGCPISQLDRVAVESLAINGAQIHLTAPGGRSVQVDDLDVDLRLRRHVYTLKLNAPGGTVDAGNVLLPIEQLRVTAGLDVDDQRLEVQKVDVGVGELSAFVSGEVRTLCDPQPDLEVEVNLPLDMVSTVVPDAPEMGGTVALKARLEGSAEDPQLSASLNLSHARVHFIDIGDLALDAHATKDAVYVDMLDLLAGEAGHIRVQGFAGVKAPHALNFKADIEQVQFGDVLNKIGPVNHPWVNFLANGSVSVKGQALPLRLSGPATLDVADFRVFDRAFDKPNKTAMVELDGAHIETQADFTLDRVKLNHSRIKTERSEVAAEVTLSTDPNKGIDATVELKPVDLADLKHVASLQWDGKVKGIGTLKGPYGPNIAIAAALTAEGFKLHQLDFGFVDADLREQGLVLDFPRIYALRGRTRLDGVGQLDFSQGEPRGKARVTVENGRVADVLATIKDEFWLFDHLHQKKTDGRISGEAVFLEGELMKPHADLHFTLEDTTYFERKLGKGEVAVRIRGPETLDIDTLWFDGPVGRLTLGGRLYFDGELGFDIDAPRLDVDALMQPDNDSVKARGSGHAHARMYGKPERIQMDGSVTVNDLQAYDTLLGSGVLALKMDGPNLSLKGPIGQDLLLDTRLVNDGADLPFAVGVSANISDLGRYLHREGMKGTLQGDVLVSGNVAHWQDAEGDLRLQTLTLGKGDYLAHNDGPVDVAFQGAAVEVRSMTLKGPTGTRLSLVGLKEADGGLDMAVEGSFDVKLVESFTPWIEQSGGKVNIQASVAGTTEKPTVVGAADLEGGRLQVHGFPVTARGLAGRVEFSQNKLYVADMTGVVNNGRAALRGDIELQEFVPHRLNLNMLMDEVQARVPDWLPSVVSGELMLHGVLDALTLEGSLDVVKARYSQDVELEKMLLEARKRRVEARNYQKQDEWLKYNVDLHVNGDARIDNNLIKCAVKGEVKLTGTNAHLGMLGEVEAEEGGRGFFRGNEFSLTRAVVTLTEKDRIAANLDVHAETQIREYKINLHAFGPWEDPQIESDSEPELAKADVVTLLTLGFTSRDRGETATAAGGSLITESLLNISGLDKHVKNFIPRNAVLRDFNFHISTQYSEASTRVEPTAQFESKFLTDSLKLRLSQPMLSGKGRRAQAEYKVNDHVSAQAQWDNENADYGIGDIGLDLKLRWELN